MQRQTVHTEKSNARVLNVGQTSRRSSVAHDNKSFQRTYPLKISDDPTLKCADRNPCLNMKRARA
jgi:hypothetical protein